MEEQRIDSLTSDNLTTGSSNHTASAGSDTDGTEVPDGMRRRNNGGIPTQKPLSDSNHTPDVSPIMANHSGGVPSETITSVQLDGVNYNARVRTLSNQVCIFVDKSRFMNE